MNSSHFPLADWADQCLAIAEAAGRAIMDVYGRDDFGKVLKDDRSPVTDADFAANAIIVPALQSLTPDLRVISEESADRTEGLSSFWLVDPLDGTREFIKRNGEFTVNIALVDQGGPVLGVITAPAKQLAYAGGVGVPSRERVGSGAWRLIQVDPEGGAQPKRVIGSKAYETDRAARWLATQFPGAEFEGLGSSLKFCRVASGAAHYYPRYGRTMEWDTAAGHAILRAAGGDVYTLDGEILRYGKKGYENSDFLASYRPVYDLTR